MQRLAVVSSKFIRYQIKSDLSGLLRTRPIGIRIAVIPYEGITAVYFHTDVAGAKSEHVYFVDGMLVLLLCLKKNKAQTLITKKQVMQASLKPEGDLAYRFPAGYTL